MGKEYNNGSRGLFATKMGVLAATVGSAVGLGNIWRFPFETGTHGGGAFLLCYVIFTVLLGIPVICAEFVMGRSTRSGILGSFRKLAPNSKWWIVGYLGIFGALIIPGFYSVVASWTVEYCVQSGAGMLNLASAQEYHEHFTALTSGTWRPLIWVVIFLSLNFLILIKGAKGIERISNILMPLLTIIIIALCVNSLTLEKASEGLRFMFHPDFSELNSKTILAALGQSFFSLSIGIGCMTTYASYFQRNTRIVQTAATTAFLDMGMAILAGIMIFPALFTFGGSVTAGPKLVFEVLPNMFSHLPGGAVWSTLFFFLLILASLTSTISLHEISIAFLVDEKGMSRKKATIVSCLIVFVLAILSSLSFGQLSDFKIFNMTFFEVLDYLASNIVMPLGGLFVSIFIGWKVKKTLITSEFTNDGTLRSHMIKVTIFSLRYIAPASIILIFLNSIGLI